MNFQEVVQVNEYKYFNPKFGEPYETKSLNLDAFVLVDITYLRNNCFEKGNKFIRLFTGIPDRENCIGYIVVKFDETLLDYFYSKAVFVGETKVNIGYTSEYLRFFVLNPNIILEINNDEVQTSIGALKLDNIVKGITK